jgi:hypothetical protein
MSGVNEAIVTEYFESLGFMVLRPCKYVIPGKRKSAFEVMDLLLLNPRATQQELPQTPIWDDSHLKGISRAVVGIMGGHSERLYPALFKKSPELLAFAGEAAMREAASCLGPGPTARILCLAGLPASSELTKDALTVLKEQGVDGVVLFKTMLQRLIARVDSNTNYEKSDVLQTIRILKKYGLFRGNQMELFERKRRSRAAKKTA